jgi:translocation and assembly module TamB
MSRRLLITIIAVTVFVVGVPSALIYYAACTEAGLQFIVSHVPKQIGRMKLTLGKASGTLASGVKIERIVIDQERVFISLEGVTGRISLAPLMWQTMYATDLTAQRAFVQVRRRLTPLPKRTPRFLPPGLTIRVDRAFIKSATLIATNGRRFDGTDVQTSGVARHRTLRFFDASFAMDAMRVSGSSTLRAADPMQLEANARTLIRMTGQPLWIISGSGKGDLDSLDLTARFNAPFRADFTGRAQDLTRGWKWSGKTQVHDFDLRAWGGGGALGQVSGTLDVRGDAKGFTAKGPLTPAGLQAGAFQANFEGNYAARVVTARRIDIVHGSSRAHLTGAGTIGIVSKGPQLDLRGTWQDFRWPLVGSEPSVRSAAGEYSLRGVWPYDLHATGNFVTPDLPEPMPFETVSKLDKTRLLLGETGVDALNGHFQLTGEVSWTPTERWAVAGRASDVDPGRVREDLPGQLAFAFAASGEGFGENGDFSVDVRELSGRLRGASASGGGKLARRASTWEFERVRVGLGRTRLALDGRVAQEMDLTFAVDADDLGLLARGSRGQLDAQGTFKGTRENPVLAATVKASNLVHENIAVGNLDARIDFDSRARRQSKIDANARNVTYGERTISDIRLALDGSAAEHMLRLTAKARNLSLDSAAQGAFSNGTWQGQLQGLAVNGSEALHLELEEPVALAFSMDRAQVDWFCLKGKPARVCGDANWNPENWSATLNANDLPITTLTAGLTRSVDYRGQLTVTARAFGGRSEPVQGSLRADLVDARIAHRLASGRTERITLGTGLVTVNASRTSIDAEAGLDAGEIGTVKGKMELLRSGGSRWQDMPLRGELRAQTAELGFISLYAPEVDRVAGSLEANLALTGTLGTPLVDGTLKLIDGEIDLYQINLALRAANLEARLLANGLDFNGSARIGGGSVSTNGQLQWRDAQPYGRFELKGLNLRVVDVPEAQIDASPDLDFRIDGRRIEVSGAVRVPFAKIVPQDLTNAVRASSDEVLVGEEPKDPSKRFEVVTGINLTLGDRVSLDTSGLTARLEGSITVRSGSDEITRGSGELLIHEGKYVAYGRKLDIQRGRLIYTGGPIGNPGIDIRAEKEYPEVVAGVNVRGTLLQPRLTFFSEPSLPQSQVVSLILAGGSFESAQNNNNRTGAGNELVAQGGAILAQQLGSRVGIEDVGLEQNLDNETSLVLGKYLSPRLYVSYGVSLTESLNTLKLRYSLNDRWTVKTEVGEARGADLVYTIEK